jgi:hypothetical protein
MRVQCLACLFHTGRQRSFCGNAISVLSGFTLMMNKKGEVGACCENTFVLETTILSRSRRCLTVHS